MKKSLQITVEILAAFAMLVYGSSLCSAKAYAADELPYGPTITEPKAASTSYSSDLPVSVDQSMIIGKNEKITINGNLNVHGCLKIDSGLLTVNGNMNVEDGDVYVEGTGRLIINKAPAGSKTGYGGKLILGDESNNKSGELYVYGSASITINYAQDGGLYVYKGSTFLMDSKLAKVSVHNSCYFDNDYAYAKNGTLEVINGDFIVRSNSAFTPSPNFKVSLISTDSTPRDVYFEKPSTSYFIDAVFKNVTFTSDSVISFNINLNSDYRIDGSNGKFLIQGNLNGHTLTVTAGEVVPVSMRSLSIGGGTLIVNGAFITGDLCYLSFGNASSKMIVNGEFQATGACFGYDKGTLEINGDFYQRTGSSGDTNTFSPSNNFTTILSGKNRLVHFDNPDLSFFTKLEMPEGTTLSVDSNVSVKYDLTKDAAWYCPNLCYSGNLNGHKLVNDGSLTIPNSESVTVGGGMMIVSGNLTATGFLIMENDNDIVTVGGTFLSNGSMGYYHLRAGKLFLKGDFKTRSDTKSFTTYGTHTLILNGTGPQTITLGSEGAEYNYFAHLIILNDSIDVSSFPHCYKDLVVSGTMPTGLGESAGALMPAFNGNSSDYLLLLPAGTDTVVLTPGFPARYHGTAWLTLEGGSAPVTYTTVSGLHPYDSNSVKIVSHAYQDIDSRTFSIKVEQLNPNLKAGAAGLGALPVDSSVDVADTAYTVDLPATASSLAFAPVTDNPDSTVSVDGAGAAKNVSVPLGGSVSCAMRVTAQDGATSKDYTVQFTRHSPLSGISISSGSMTFDASTGSYSVNVPASMTSVTVSVLKNDTDCNGAVTINGEATESKAIPLAPGSSAIATVRAQDGNGKSTTTYTIEINCINMLSGVKLSTGALSPAFAAQTSVYSVFLSNSATSLTVTPVKTASCSSMKINGQAVASVKLSPASGGMATATIACAYGSGAQAVSQTYTINVYRIMPVSNIALSAGKLTPAFAPAAYAYTVRVPATTASVTVTPAKTTSCLALTINGLSAASCKLTPPAGGSAAAKIVATARNGAKYTYTVTVKRAAVLSGLKLSTGALSPAFNPAVQAYTVNVPATTALVTVTPLKVAGVKSVAINGKAAASADLKPPVGGSAAAAIVVTAADGKTKVTYTVTVRRAALVTGIAVSAGALAPAFNPTVPSYTVYLPSATPSVTITPAKGAGVKSLTIGGVAQTTGTFSLEAGGEMSVAIVATAADGKTKSTYTVKVVRAAYPLQSLTATAGTDQALPLSPAFDGATLDYSVTAPIAGGVAAQVKLDVAPAAGDTATLNGAAGTELTLNKPEGSDALAVTVVVTQGHGLPDVTYTVTVTWAE